MHYLSIHPDLWEKLIVFDNIIAKDLLNGVKIDSEKYINYLGISEDNEGYISYLDNQRISKMDSSEYYNPKKRYHAKPSKVIELLFPKKYSDKQKEDFTVGFRNEVRKCCIDENLISIMEGEDIRDAYLQKNYYKAEITENSLIGASCMRFDEQQTYLDIYVKNPNQIKLAVCLSERGKVRARCLLWYIKNEIYYDRIYAVNNELAKDMQACFDLREYKNISNKNLIAVFDVEEEVVLENVDFDYYPYLDTFYFMNFKNKTLYSYQAKGIDRLLHNTNGSYDKIYGGECCVCRHRTDELYYVVCGRYEGEQIGNCCAVYSPSYEGWINRGSSVFIEGNGYVLKSDAVCVVGGAYELEGDCTRMFNGEFVRTDSDSLLYSTDGYFLKGDENFEEIDGNWVKIERIREVEEPIRTTLEGCNTFTYDMPLGIYERMQTAANVIQYRSTADTFSYIFDPYSTVEFLNDRVPIRNTNTEEELPL